MPWLAASMGRAGAFVLATLSLIACSKQQPAPARMEPQVATSTRIVSPEAERAACLAGANEALGVGVQLLRCGHLSGRDALEAVAIIRVPKLVDDQDGVPLKRLVVIQQLNTAWEDELTVENEIKNPVGYLAADYIDDSEPANWFRVSLSGEGTKDFTIVLRYVDTKGVTDDEGLPDEIGWNPAVNRYQELLLNREGFAEEKKTLPHIRTRKDCGSGPCP